MTDRILIKSSILLVVRRYSNELLGLIHISTSFSAKVNWANFEFHLNVKVFIQSYGPDYGNNGYIDYVRGDENLEICDFYKTAYILKATYRRGK